MKKWHCLSVPAPVPRHQYCTTGACALRSFDPQRRHLDICDHIPSCHAGNLSRVQLDFLATSWAASPSPTFPLFYFCCYCYCYIFPKGKSPEAWEGNCVFTPVHFQLWSHLLYTLVHAPHGRMSPFVCPCTFGGISNCVWTASCYMLSKKLCRASTCVCYVLAAGTSCSCQNEKNSNVWQLLQQISRIAFKQGQQWHFTIR